MQISPLVEMLTMDEIIKKTGWGTFHKIVLAIVGICGIADGMALVSLPLCLPHILCDIDISTNILTSINICLAISTALGGLFLSALSDIIGRKGLINLTLVIIFLGAMICSIAYYYTTVIVSIMLIGAGLASNFNIAKIYLAEILPAHNRGRYLVIVDLLYTMGYIGLVGLAWAFSNSILNYYQNGARMFTWRMLFGLIGLITIITSCTSAILLSGPRFLILQKRYKDALEVLKEMFAVNKSKLTDYYPVVEADLHNAITDYGILQEFNHARLYAGDRGFLILKRFHKSLMLLFHKKFIKATFCITILKICTSYGSFIMNMWLAKMLTFVPKSELLGSDLFHFQLPVESCKYYDGGTGFYAEFLIISGGIVVGEIILIIFIDKVGRKIFISFALFCSGVWLLLLAFITTYKLRMLLSWIVMMSYTIADSSINVVLIEAFPTAIRGTASGQTQFLARLGLIFLRQYIRIPCYLSFVIVGSIMFASSLLANFIPELSRKPMVE